MKHLTKPLIAFCFLIFFTSCLSTSVPPTPSSVLVTYNVPNAGEEFSTADDTIKVLETTFHMQNLTLSGQESGYEFVNEDVNATYNTQFQDPGPRNIALEQLTEGTYDEFNFSTEVRQGNTGNDNEYSIRVYGTYNSLPFTFETNLTFDKTLPFSSPIQIQKNGANLLIGMEVYVVDWFYTEDKSEILDPSDSDNLEAIESKIKSSIIINAEKITGN